MTADPTRDLEALSAGIAAADHARSRGAGQDAHDILVDLLKRFPDQPAVASRLASLCLDADRPADALDALAALTDHPAVAVHRARALECLGRRDEAIAVLETALAAPAPPLGAYVFLAQLLRGTGDLDRALDCLDCARQHAPDDQAVLNGLANALVAAGRAEEALLALQPAAARHDAHPVLLCNAGTTAMMLDRTEQARRYFDAALAKAPDHADALVNRGLAYLAENAIGAAETDLRAAIAARPDDPAAHYNLAWLLLLTGRMAEGWQSYRWRWRLPEFSSRRMDYGLPEWDGTPITAGTLLLHAEQGFGDAIQLARYIPAAAECAPRVTVHCHPPLVGLFRDSFAGRDTIRVLPFADRAPPEAVAAAPFFDLPALFGDPVAGPRVPLPTPPYLRTTEPANPPSSAAVPNPSRQRRTGFVWAGSGDNKIDRYRSIAPERLRPLAERADTLPFSLQIGEPAPAPMIDLASGIADFRDTARCLRKLDLVITVDTAIAHLAGAMDLTTFVLLPFAPDYRWLLDRSDSPWYPSVRLFRQPAPGDWDSVIAAVGTALDTADDLA